MKNTSVVFELMHVDDNQNGDSPPLHMFFFCVGGNDPDTNTGTRMFG